MTMKKEKNVLDVDVEMCGARKDRSKNIHKDVRVMNVSRWPHSRLSLELGNGRYVLSQNRIMNS